jgi:hypothetical protein
MKQVSIYTASVHAESTEEQGPCSVRFNFLFLPTPDNLILAIQNEIASLESEIRDAEKSAEDGDNEVAEDAEVTCDTLQGRVALLQRLCEVAASCKGLPKGITDTVVHDVRVAGVRVGSIQINVSSALARDGARL